MSSNAAHLRYEKQLKKSAAKAFAGIPPGQEEIAVQSRAQLLNWLVEMDATLRDVRKLVSDDHANVAASAFETALEHQKTEDPGIQDLITAFQKLSDDQVLNLFRYVLGAFLVKASVGANLVTRGRGEEFRFWDVTGFNIDSACQTVFAKVGSREGQPIGFTDDNLYVPTEGSKTLWIRDFGISLTFPYHSAFAVSRENLLPRQAMSTDILSKSQLAQIDEIVGWFRADLGEYDTAETEDAKKAVMTKMRDTVKLVRIRIPPFDKLVEDTISANPQLGAELENVDIAQFVSAAVNWFHQKRDDAAVADTIAATTTLVGDKKEALIDTVMGVVSGALPPEGQNPDVEKARVALVQACASFPVLSAAVEAAPTLLEQLKVALLELQKLKSA